MKMTFRNKKLERRIIKNTTIRIIHIQLRCLKIIQRKITADCCMNYIIQAKDWQANNKEHSALILKKSLECEGMTSLSLCTAYRFFIVL